MVPVEVSIAILNHIADSRLVLLNRQKNCYCRARAVAVC
jgi:hypothetical protein